MTLTGKTLAEDVQYVKKYGNLIDVVELRVDHLNEDEQLYAKCFPSLVRLPCILTIRRDVDGGKFDGGEFSRTSLFGRALAFANQNKEKNFAYVDFEDDYHIPGIEDAAMAFGVRIIRSFHDMNSPVVNLKKKADSMRKTGFEIPKIAMMPHTLDDVTRFFKEAQDFKDYDHILCAMGPQGLPSRILSTHINSYLTYVSPPETCGNTTNIGHIDPITINQMYHFKNINPSTKLFAVTGYPLTKSYTCELYNRAFHCTGMDAVCLPVVSNSISDILEFAEQVNIRGLSICPPNQESVIYYLYDQALEVVQTGICNMVTYRNGKWFGFNADVYGFRRALQEFIGDNKLRRKKVAIIGAGSVAKTVAYVIKQMGGRACIFNRTLEHAKLIAEKYGFEYAALEPSNADILDEYSSIIFQLTTLGADTSTDDVQKNDPIYFYNFRGNEMLFDSIFSVERTPVMKRAAEAGCRTCNGRKMIEYQALEEFRIFTGKEYEA